MPTTEQIANYNTSSPPKPTDWLLTQPGAVGTNYTKTPISSIVQTLNKAFVYASGTTSLTGGNVTTIELTTALFDTGSMFVASGNALVVSLSGYYQLVGQVYANQPAPADGILPAIYVNGVEIFEGNYARAPTGGGACEATVAGIALLASGAIVTLRCYADGTDSTIASPSGQFNFLTALGPF